MGGSLGKSEGGSSSYNTFDGSSSDYDRSYTQNNQGSIVDNNNVTGSYDIANSGSGSNDLSQGKSGANQDVWGQQAGALGGLYNTLGGLSGKSGAGVGDQMAGGQQFSQGALDSVQNPWNQQMQGGAYANMGLQDNLMNSLNQSLQNPSATQEVNNMIMGGQGNNYADAMRDQYVQDANRASDNMLQNLDARAAASGMSGGSRHGTATAQGMQDINQNLQRNMAQTGYNTFDKDLDRKLAIAQQADQGTLARQQMMQQMIGGQQGSMDTGISNAGNMLGMGQSQQMMPWQQAGAYGSILGGPTVLDNSFANNMSQGSSNAFDKGQAGSYGADTGGSSTWDRGITQNKSGGSSAQTGTGTGSASSKGLGLSGGK